jgi:iron complex transport system substrate-binding protein
LKKLVATLVLMILCAVDQREAWAEPHRIVSLNPCLDVILVNVADRDQIAALSHFSREDTSTITTLAQTFPVSYETAEEVMAFAPDMVLTSRHSSLATRNALARVQIRTELFNEPETVADSIAQVRAVAELVEHADRGEELVARIEAALRAAGPPDGATLLSALVYQRNGFSTGSGTLVDEMLTRTGFTNAAGRYGLVGWGNIPLESVVADPPQVLLAGEIRPDVPTWADRVMRHPALKSIEGQMKRAVFPDRFLYCGGPVLIGAAKALLDARNSASVARP